MWSGSTKIDSDPVSQMRSTQQQWKIVDVVDILNREKAVTLTAKGSSLIEIHGCLRSMYGEDAIDVSSVRCWVHCVNSGDKEHW
jgi:hypothetical protein